MTDHFTWTFDLDDRCLTDCGDFGAHAKSLDDNCWYCHVYRLPWAPNTSDERYVFHSEDSDIMPKTGDAARRLCEFIIRAARAGVFITDPLSIRPRKEKS